MVLSMRVQGRISMDSVKIYLGQILNLGIGLWKLGTGG